MHFTVFEGDAVGYLLHVVSGEVLVEIYVIYLLLEELGMGQLASQLAVVGEQEHTHSVAVKTTHGVDALGASVLDEVHHGLALLGVIHCGDIVLGLVEQHVHLLLDGHGLVVELHLVGAQHLGTQFGHYLAVDGDHACLDKLVGLAA